MQQNPELSHYLLQFLYQFYLKKHYHFIELEIVRSQRRIIKQFTSSLTLASTIYFEIPECQTNDFYDSLFLDVVMHVYSFICRIRNEYVSSNILVINDGGKIANEALMDKIRQYERYNVRYSYRYLYELKEIDFSKYDVVFLSESFNYDISKIPIPTLFFDFSLSSEFSSLLWSRVFSSKRKIGSVMNYLVNPQIVELAGDYEHIVQEITNYFAQLSEYQPNMSPDIFRQYIETIILNADYSKYSVNKLNTLFATSEMKNRYFIFRLNEPVTIRDRQISNLQSVFLDLAKGLLEIKNGDSQLRRYTI